jgi:1,4-alpha-glucan branching enzyme
VTVAAVGGAQASEEDVKRLLALRHPDPHSVLGIHPMSGGVALRAFRPDASAIAALPDDGRAPIPLRPRGQGFFEAWVPGPEKAFSYLLEVSYPHGASFRLRDPYCFLPTLGEVDLHLTGEGRHRRLWEKLGAQPLHFSGVAGVAFAVWAPTAAGVSVVGDFNGWDGRLHAMREMGSSGVWELFIPEVGEGTRYKFEIRPRHGGPPLLKADPFAFRTEVPPATASVVHSLKHYRWGDGPWMQRRRLTDWMASPLSIYEVHLGSWKRVVEDGGRPLTYREAAVSLAGYAKQMGFTHVELLPVAEHPFGGSWGYQVGSYFSPTARYGHPDDLRFFVDHLHQQGLGVIVDWVPGHFPRDAHGLARFDGSAVYEHEDPRQGAHPDWGTLVFNFGRNEVRNFLVDNALFWLDEYHVDGLRVDAVASMLYLDYSRRPGEWIPNKGGGRENDEAIAFLREVNEAVRDAHPGAMMIAEESTAWPQVTARPREGGLGFELKWNMGWMNDTLAYFAKDPVHRKFHHHQLTFGLLYAFSERFVLPLSHDEVVHGKGSLFGRMPGDDWQKAANLRALFAWMWAHPGKKLLFMGSEIGQFDEWHHERSLDWHLLADPAHLGIQQMVRDLNRRYAANAALYQVDFAPAGFQWLQADSADVNVFAFVRRSHAGDRHLVCVANLSPVPRVDYRVGLPEARRYVEVLNTDAKEYGGSGVRNAAGVTAEARPWDNQPASAALTLPPLGIIWLEPA